MREKGKEHDEGGGQRVGFFMLFSRMPFHAGGEFRMHASANR